MDTYDEGQEQAGYQPVPDVTQPAAGGQALDGYQAGAAEAQPAEIEMSAMYVGHHGHPGNVVVDEPGLDVVREGQIKDRVVAEGTRRLDEDLTLFNTAMSSFATHARQMAATLPKGQTEFSFWSVVEALQPAVAVLFPVEGVAAEFGKELIKGGVEYFEKGLKAAYEGSTPAAKRDEAREDLDVAAAGLVAAATQQALAAWGYMKAGLPGAVASTLEGIDTEGHLVTAQWIGQICDQYLGIPEPTVRRGHDDVRAKLEEAFAGVYWMIDNRLRETEYTPAVVRDAATAAARQAYQKEGDQYWNEETREVQGS